MLPHSLILPLTCCDSTDRQAENNFITACFYPNGILIKIVANSPGDWSTVRQTQAEDMRLADVNWRSSQLDEVWIRWVTYDLLLYKKVKKKLGLSVVWSKHNENTIQVTEKMYRL